MNFRITTLLFGLLLTTLWVFGLMIAHKKGAVDQSPIVPTLASRDATVESIKIKPSEIKDKDGKTKKAGEFEFVFIGDRWYYQEGKQKVRVEGSRVKEMIDAITNARPDESADLTKTLSAYGLEPPQLTVELFGKVKEEKKDWKFFVGKESPDGASYYVNSSERPDKAHLVPKRSIERLFVSNPNNLRSKRLFDPTEAQIKTIEIKKGDKRLEIQRSEGNIWTAIEPKNLGFLGFDSSAPEDKMPKDDPHKDLLKEKDKKKDEPISGVKALLATIIKVTVENDDDFVPLGGNLADYGLDKDPPMRVEITTSDDGKAIVKETLLIGKQVPGRKETAYYARLAADDGVFILPAKTIEPIEKAVANPEKLRSLDLAVFDSEKIDYINFRHKDEDVKLTLLDRTKNWEMFVIKEKKKEGDVLEMKKTNDTAVESFVKSLVGKGAIVEFVDVSEADLKKKLTEFELEKPAVEITLYAEALDKKDEKKDKKDDKKDDKKSEADKNKMPDLKKDLKAKLKLEFGKIDGDKVYARRTLDTGATNLMLVKKEFLDKLLPAESVELSYMDAHLPVIEIPNVFGIKVQGLSDKSEPLELTQRALDGQSVWYTKDKSWPTGEKIADSKAASGIVVRFGTAEVKKWVKKFDDKTDLEPFGLKKPVATVTIRTTQPAQDMMTAMGVFGSAPAIGTPLDAFALIAARHNSAKGTEEIVFELGKEVADDATDKDKEKDKKDKDKKETRPKDREKTGVYAKRSGTNMIFVLPIESLKYLKDTDFRDRASAMNVQAQLVAAQAGMSAAEPVNALLFGSPYFTGQLYTLDADKIKEVKLTVRSRYELRSFAFQRDLKDKDKTWSDKSGLQEFSLDQDKVNQFVKDYAKLHADRMIAIAGGARDEHKLGAKDQLAKIDFVMEDGQTVTLQIGGRYLVHGYYATTSYWPNVVFMLPLGTVDPILNGAEHFAKERPGAN
jgi:hypothetical protein